MEDTTRTYKIKHDGDIAATVTGRGCVSKHARVPLESAWSRDVSR